MAQIKTFRDAIVWQKAHKLALETYLVVSKFPKHEEFGLSSQMRRCAVSIPSNIVEGFQRATLKDTKHFLNISTGSLEELKYQILLSRDLGYMTEESYKNLCSLADEVGRLLYAWYRNLKY